MPRREPTPPSADLLKRMERELSRELLSRLYQWADGACARLLAIEGRDDPGYARTMVQDAIGDTYAGIRVWDADRRSLAHHLMRVVTSRLSHDVARARLRRHVSFHEVNDSSDENSAAVEMSLRRDDERSRPDGRLAIVEGRARVFGALRAFASNDNDVIALVDAYEAGHTRRDEAMARLGWRLGQHVNVRRRLDTLIRHLPAELRETALEILVRDGGAAPLTVARKAGRAVPLVPDGEVAEPGEDPDGECEGDPGGQGDSADGDEQEREAV